MKIYTGYFGGMRHYVGLRYIAISRCVPVGLKWRVPNCRALNPTLHILQMKTRPAEYEKAYGELLGKLDAKEILNSISLMSQDKDCVLLCYEKPGAFCHRHLVAKWLTEKLGIEVEEVKI